MNIGKRDIGDGNPCYIIGEIGKNYNGDIKIAEKLIRTAASCGFDAVKFQSIRAETLIIKDMPKVAHLKDTTQESFFAAHKKVELSEDEHRYLMGIAKDENIEFFSTPEDVEMVELLDRIGVNVFKVASLDLTYNELVDSIASKGKPIILSTGMSNLGEIESAVNRIMSKGNKNIAILHCISNYPPKDEHMNLRFIKMLKVVFPFPIGFSDHTIGSEAALATVSIGASMVEKHITLDKNMPGPDHRISADPEEMAKMVRSIRRVESMLGSGLRYISDDEMIMRKNVRRKIVAARNLSAGEILRRDMVHVKIAPSGLPAEGLDKVIGKKARVAISEDEGITWDKLE